MKVSHFCSRKYWWMFHSTREKNTKIVLFARKYGHLAKQKEPLLNWSCFYSNLQTFLLVFHFINLSIPEIQFLNTCFSSPSVKNRCHRHTKKTPKLASNEKKTYKWFRLRNTRWLNTNNTARFLWRLVKKIEHSTPVYFCVWVKYIDIIRWLVDSWANSSRLYIILSVNGTTTCDDIISCRCEIA